MSDLFSNLTSAARALDAQRMGMEVVGQNLANVNTPGFSRRAVDLAAVAPDGSGSAGRGVDVVGVRALRDLLIERRVRQETTLEQRESAKASALSVVEASLGQAGSSIDEHLSEFFDAFANLSETPTSAVARREVQLQGESIATAFHDIAGRLDSARRNADQDIDGTVDEVNSLVGRIAAMNKTIGSTAPDAEGALHLRDEQAELVKKLSGLLDISVLPRDVGGVDISIGNGQPLVVGEYGYPLETVMTGPGGFRTILANDTDATSQITGGRLGGLLHVRDVSVPDYQARLDEMAYSLATQVNTVHSAGYDGAGAAAGDFFAFSSVLSGSTGAAKALVLDSAVAASPDKIAAASVSAAGDNRTATAIAALRDARALDGGTATLSDAWGQLVYRVGRDTADAVSDQKSRAEIVSQVEALRDQVSGISMDEEAMHLIKFQRAYEANARFFNAINEALDVLMQTVS